MEILAVGQLVQTPKQKDQEEFKQRSQNPSFVANKQQQVNY
jgi:hypothetical protein